MMHSEDCKIHKHITPNEVNPHLFTFQYELLKKKKKNGFIPKIISVSHQLNMGVGIYEAT